MKNSFLIVLFGLIIFDSSISIGKIFKSGQYEYLTIVNNNNEIYGLFQYYDKWDKKYNDYDNKCVFYLHGFLTKSDTIHIQVGIMGEKTRGFIVLHKNDSFTLFFSNNNFTPGYGIVDFVYDGYNAQLTQDFGNKYCGLGTIKSDKSFFYNDPIDNSVSKAYLVAGDCVQIIQYKDDWAKIEYISPSPNSSKVFTKWIKATTLYDKDPAKW